MAIYTEGPIAVTLKTLGAPGSPDRTMYHDLYENTHTVVATFVDTAYDAARVDDDVWVRWGTKNRDNLAAYGTLWAATGYLKLVYMNQLTLQFLEASKTPGSRRIYLTNLAGTTSMISLTEVVGVTT